MAEPFTAHAHACAVHRGCVNAGRRRPAPNGHGRYGAAPHDGSRVTLVDLQGFAGPAVTPEASTARDRSGLRLGVHLMDTTQLTERGPP
jgi:hypothetical protein